jgi:acetyltransferase-like isoleucine patch superfamily enzyme
VARDTTPPPPSAFARFGSGSVIVPPARVSEPHHIEVGDDVIVLEGSWLSVVSAHSTPARLVLGSGTRIGRYAHIACVGEVVFGANVLTSERVFVGDTYHGYEQANVPILHQPMAAAKPVHIGDGAFLGIGAIVLLGVTVGENAYVGAGAVVTQDVPPRTVVVGNPARVIREWDDGSSSWVDVK